MPLNSEEILQLDRAHIWHPYASLDPEQPLYAVRSAAGVHLSLADGRQLVDGMASWWSAIHGYNHPALNAAVYQQTQAMAHVMFGGLTHEPAARLAAKLVEITPAGLNRVFFADSGSVGVEVAIKMALQFWLSRNRPQKHRMLSLKKGYHGDTLGAMSICDPVTGMHHLFSKLLPENLFADAPECRFGEACTAEHLASITSLLEQHADSLAAVVLEPIVQGAGGMRFYSADYLRSVKALCQQYDVLLIADEIATGFGRTGKLFACEHAAVAPDILCLGKALTGGYMTLSATLCTDRVAQGICAGEAGVFMHGPTFMANPLACSVALASLELLLAGDWQSKVAAIEAQLGEELAPCAALPGVKDVRVLGAIGVIELAQPVDMKRLVPMLVDAGIWIRPFGKLVYTMPPYIIRPPELSRITQGLYTQLKRYLASD